MKVTGYDRMAAGVLTAFLALGLTAAFLGAIWAAGHDWSRPEPVPLELVVVSGGEPDGAENETLDLKTPFEERPDASMADIEAPTEVEPMLDSVVDLADRATDMAQRQPQAATVNAGQPGSRSGSGAAALGMGPGEGGVPREQRWFVSFGDGGSLTQYARQLDYFKIELGAVLTGGKVVYLSNLAADKPTVRRVDSGAGENRLYMTWQGGGRRRADLDLFAKAGVDIGGAGVFHFYPPETEEALARLETAHRNRKTADIRRTYFAVIAQGPGFRFFVTRQAYFR